MVPIESIKKFMSLLISEQISLDKALEAKPYPTGNKTYLYECFIVRARETRKEAEELAKKFDKTMDEMLVIVHQFSSTVEKEVENDKPSFEDFLRELLD